MATLDTTALVTVDELKTHLEIVGTRRDKLLVQLVNAASSMLEGWCRVPLIQRQFVDRKMGGPTPYQGTYAPVYGGDGLRGGRKRIWLDNYPIVSVVSIQDGQGNVIPTTDYHIQKDYGTLEHFAAWPAPYDAQGLLGEWIITYSAGWFTSTDAVPWDVKQACFMQAGLLLANKTGAAQSTSTGNLSVSFEVDEDGIARPVKTALTKYKGNRI